MALGIPESEVVDIQTPPSVVGVIFGAVGKALSVIKDAVCTALQRVTGKDVCDIVEKLFRNCWKLIKTIASNALDFAGTLVLGGAELAGSVLGVTAGLERFVSDMAENLGVGFRDWLELGNIDLDRLKKLFAAFTEGKWGDVLGTALELLDYGVGSEKIGKGDILGTVPGQSPFFGKPPCRSSRALIPGQSRSAELARGGKRTHSRIPAFPSG